MVSLKNKTSRKFAEKSHKKPKILPPRSSWQMNAGVLLRGTVEILLLGIFRLHPLHTSGRNRIQHMFGILNILKDSSQ